MECDLIKFQRASPQAFHVFSGRSGQFMMSGMRFLPGVYRGCKWGISADHPGGAMIISRGAARGADYAAALPGPGS